ncbi:alpha/beta hydrolase [Devosia sp.]|uniref:alpha/beta hydrolase n=1 Tax=Devosia sp. TaxID=1871048 RepID=UPI002FC59C6F
MTAITPAGAFAEVQQLPRGDGSVIRYSLDVPPDGNEGLLVLAQGSGCEPAIGSANLATVRAAFPQYSALIVEKAGVTGSGDADQSDDICSQEFVDTFTFTGRVQDYETVLEHLTTDGNAGAEIVLFGGSEGGLAMEMLAARLQPKATIILSGSVGTTFGDMVLASVPPEGQPIVEAGFADARANPSSEMFSGHTKRFWADILDHRSSAYLKATETPVLLIYGGRDESSSVQAARTLADSFAKEGRCNLVWWEFPGLDHGMADPSGKSYLDRVANLASAWVEAPIPAC